MTNPTGSTMRTTVPSAGTTKSKMAGKRPQYTAPTILTYTDDQLLREVSSGKVTRAPHTRRV